MDVVTILIGIFVIVILWTLLKFVLKLTAKIFSCGMIVILVVALILIVQGVVEAPAF